MRSVGVGWSVRADGSDCMAADVPDATHPGRTDNRLGYPKAGVAWKMRKIGFGLRSSEPNHVSRGMGRSVLAQSPYPQSNLM